MADELGGERVAALPAGDELDDRFDLLPHLLVGHADDGDVGDRRVEDEHVLDLLRVDVHPAGDDRERLAVGEEQIPLLVEVADVADRGPGGVVGVLRLARLLGIAVIGEGQDLPLEVDGADRSRRHLAAVLAADADGSEDRPAHRARPG